MKAAIILLLLVLSPKAFDSVDAIGVVTEESDCLAIALATADPSNSIGEAISNSIAQAFSRVVACDGVQENHRVLGASSLAISVAVAIASSETVGADCVAESDAVADVVSETVTQGVARGLLENTDPVQQTLAEAWLAEEISAIATKLQEGEDSFGTTSGACSPSGLRSSLSTARAVGAALDQAISRILLAITCGDHLETVDPEGITPGGSTSTTSSAGGDIEASSAAQAEMGEVENGCRYDSKKEMFYGPCQPAATKRRNCNEEFRQCENAGRPTETCHEELRYCSDAIMTEVVGKEVKRPQ
ncbi:hypothetical protein BSKO_10376 [Bryopsis sp. KO-2023]|nr:hypothetical protein BSKO_10376 [Bryopsis sp. KO-2023]